MLEKTQHHQRLLPNDPEHLDQFSIGPMIAKGCEGVVYAANFRTPVIEESESDELPPQNLNTEDSHLEKTEIEPPGFNLAIKMMFNYDTESIAHAIWNRMQNELVPSKTSDWQDQMEAWHSGTKVKMKRLPPHPNIVSMEGAFVDEIPELRDASIMYPHALPERLNAEGFGRNKTMFSVMKKYQMTLKEYLQSRTLTLQESVLLFVQLLEAIIHLQNHGFAHRDLKTNNLLVDVDSTGLPTLALTDFGFCCQAGIFGLRVHYSCGDISIGGNGALMAPEIALAQPGFSSWLNYTKSDLWAAGAIAYEIFGADNPFTTRDDRMRLHSRTYEEKDLPALPEHVPNEIQNAVYSLLKRNPSERPSPVSAANALHLWLWAPVEVKNSHPSDLLFRRWLITTAACVTIRSTFAAPNLKNTLQMLYLSHF
jgi:serine/threonine protein kinase